MNGHNILSALRQKADELKEFEDKLSQAEEEVGRLKDRVRQISQEELPDLMDEAEQTEVTTSSGDKIRMSVQVRANLSKAKAEALGWLEENGHGDLIKRQFVISFDRDDEDWARQFSRDLAKRKKPLNTKVERTVHPSTLTSFVKGLLEEGVAFPQETFGVFRQRFAEVKRSNNHDQE